MTKQLSLQFDPPVTVDVDGIEDERHGIRYIGRATKQLDGKWRCLADVCGALAVVEVSIKAAT